MTVYTIDHSHVLLSRVIEMHMWLMQLYLHNILSHAGLITIFACIQECYADFCMGVQHSCPNLLLVLCMFDSVESSGCTSCVCTVLYPLSYSLATV